VIAEATALPTVILCGGKGSRAYPHAETVPKALFEVGGKPVLEHVMGVYALQGFRDFVLAGGYLIDALRVFADRIQMACGWRVAVSDTGLEANTGERVKRCAERAGERFFLTYCDGLANVDLHGLLDHHLSHGALMTVTAVPLQSQYGILELDGGDRVRCFREKPLLPQHLVNGGFFVVERAALAYCGDDLEHDMLPKLAADGQLVARRHDGFWRSMDTYKDLLDLRSISALGEPPWLSV